MKLTLASNNRAFSRTQWLLIICLAVIAFDFGARYAEQQFSVASKPKPTNSVVVTNLLLTTATLEEPETNLPDTNYVTYRVWNAPPTNKYAARPPGVHGSAGEPKVIDATSPTTRRKLPPPRTNVVFGIRIAIP